ncbi:MAG: integration host factor subunit alpha [Syntrophaceae bacterium]
MRKDSTMKITRQWLVDIMYNQHHDLTKERCKEIVDSFFEIIMDELSKGNNVLVSGFGKWSIRSKRQRIGRNPKTGQKTIISARKVVTFKCSDILKDELQLK